MRPRHLAICAIMVVAAAIPAAAAQAAPATKAGVTKSAVKAAKPAPKAVVKPVKPGKPVKPVKVVKVPFTVNGAVTAVDPSAGTVTIAVTGGMKDLRGTTVTVTLAVGAKIVVDEARAGLPAVQVGSRVTAVGVRAGSVLSGTKLSAVSPDPVEAPEVVPPLPEEPVTA